jgi:hypothetical protein
MIDWFNLMANSLWILGCAVGLATLSYASWEASTCQEKLRQRLKMSHIQVALNLAGLFFCLGLAGTSRPVWQIVLWLVMALLFLVQMGMEIYHKRAGTPDLE